MQPRGLRKPFGNVRENISRTHKQAQIPRRPGCSWVLSLRQAKRDSGRNFFLRLMPPMNRFRADLAARGCIVWTAKGEYADVHSLPKKPSDTMLNDGRLQLRQCDGGDAPSAIGGCRRKLYTDANLLPLAAASRAATDNPRTLTSKRPHSIVFRADHVRLSRSKRHAEFC